MVLRPNMNLEQYVAAGVNFICLGTDLGIIQTALKAKLQM